MSDITEFTAAVNQICSERGIDPEAVFEALEVAVLNAYKKDYGGGENIKAEVDRDSGEVHIIADKKVVKKVDDKDTQIGLAEAQKLEPNLEEGDHVEIEIPVEGFGRIAAQTAKQVILQKIRESEKDAVISEFKERVNTVVTGLIQRMMGPTAVVEVGKAIAQMPPEEQIPNEFYKIGERYKFYLKEITENQELVVSRSAPEFLIELFRLEVPEIESGIVEIKACAREAGSRSKLAVLSNQDGIDPIGSCVGQKGVRIANVMSELGEEKIDIIEWDENIETFVANALNPAQVESVKVDDGVATVKVSDDQLSLAIGKDGQNVRLAAKLTGLKIDITSPSLETTAKVSGDEKAVAGGSEPELSKRVANALEKAGLKPEDLLTMDEDKISEIPGIGPSSLEEIKKYIAASKESLKPEESKEEPSEGEVVKEEVTKEKADKEDTPEEESSEPEATEEESQPAKESESAETKSPVADEKAESKEEADESKKDKEE